MVIVLVSAKGSPGVTSTALALGATWPGESQAVVVEADSSGGDITSAFGLAGEPGLLSLAAASRRDSRPGLLWEHTQELPGGLRVIAAPLVTEQAVTGVDLVVSSSVLVNAAHHNTTPHDAAAHSAATQSTVLVDAGRLPPVLSSPAHVHPVIRLLRQADVILLVASNDRAGLIHAASRLEALTALTSGDTGHASSGLQLILIGSTYSAVEVSDALHVPVAGVLPRDEKAAAVLAGRRTRAIASLGRLPLMRAAARISAHLSQSRNHEHPPADVDGHPDARVEHHLVSGSSRNLQPPAASESDSTAARQVAPVTETQSPQTHRDVDPAAEGFRRVRSGRRAHLLATPPGSPPSRAPGGSDTWFDGRDAG